MKFPELITEFIIVETAPGDGVETGGEIRVAYHWLGDFDREIHEIKEHEAFFRNELCPPKWQGIAWPMVQRMAEKHGLELLPCRYSAVAGIFFPCRKA